MKLKGLILVIAVIVFSILATLTGCDEKSKNNETNDDIEQTEQIKMKAGIYGYVATGEEGLYDGDVSITLEDDGTIAVYDAFAGLGQIGTYKIEGNKIVGIYTTATFIDHTNGGDTTKEINDDFEFEIIDEETIKDITGYGGSVDHVMMEGALYKYNNVGEETVQ